MLLTGTVSLPDGKGSIIVTSLNEINRKLAGQISYEAGGFFLDTLGKKPDGTQIINSYPVIPWPPDKLIGNSRYQIIINNERRIVAYDIDTKTTKAVATLNDKTKVWEWSIYTPAPIETVVIPRQSDLGKQGKILWNGKYESLFGGIGNFLGDSSSLATYVFRNPDINFAPTTNVKGTRTHIVKIDSSDPNNKTITVQTMTQGDKVLKITPLTVAMTLADQNQFDAHRGTVVPIEYFEDGQGYALIDSDTGEVLLFVGPV